MWLNLSFSHGWIHSLYMVEKLFSHSANDFFIRVDFTIALNDIDANEDCKFESRSKKLDIEQNEMITTTRNLLIHFCVKPKGHCWSMNRPIFMIAFKCMTINNSNVFIIQWALHRKHIVNLLSSSQLTLVCIHPSLGSQPIF